MLWFFGNTPIKIIHSVFLPSLLGLPFVGLVPGTWCPSPECRCYHLQENCWWISVMPPLSPMAYAACCCSSNCNAITITIKNNVNAAISPAVVSLAVILFIFGGCAECMKRWLCLNTATSKTWKGYIYYLINLVMHFTYCVFAASDRNVCIMWNILYLTGVNRW